MTQSRNPGTVRADWPSVEEQLAEAKTSGGSALERLIRDNQDFNLLHPHEAHDRLGYPPWLRVYWRKAHPEGNYAANDPSGGYPMVLGRIHAWLLSHPPEVHGICRFFEALRRVRKRLWAH